MELVCSCAFPIHRGARHWWLLRSWPHVYCGSCARQVARPSRGFVSVQHCLRDSTRLFLKLHCGNDAAWGCCMAVEAGRSCCTRSPVPSSSLSHHSQSSLASVNTKCVRVDDSTLYG